MDVWCGAGDCWLQEGLVNAIGRRDIVFCYYTQTENFKHFDYLALYVYFREG